MTTETREKKIRLVFIGSLLLKGLNALFEIFWGMIFLVGGTVSGLIQLLIQSNLYAHSQFFAAFYLFVHATIKIFLIVALIRNKLWAYPTAIGVFSFFILYQLYRFAFNHSMFLALLTTFDVLIVWLVWHEYKLIKNKV